MTPRYSARRPFVCGVTLSCDGLVGQGTLLNLSVPGCLIDTGLKLKVGHFIQMRLTLAPAQGSLWIALAAVRWVQCSKAGIEFIRMSEGDQARLRMHVGMVDRRRTSTWSEHVMWTGISGV
ncbi:PilZ domain-containing protein [Nitrospira sp. Nam80]